MMQHLMARQTNSKCLAKVKRLESACPEISTIQMNEVVICTSNRTGGRT